MTISYNLNKGWISYFVKVTLRSICLENFIFLSNEKKHNSLIFNNKKKLKNIRVVIQLKNPKPVSGSKVNYANDHTDNFLCKNHIVLNLLYRS